MKSYIGLAMMDFWKELSGIDLMLSIDLVSLLKENEHLHRQLDELRSEIVVMDAIKREGN
jgi:hypothetical protein